MATKNRQPRRGNSGRQRRPRAAAEPTVLDETHAEIELALRDLFDPSGTTTWPGLSDRIAALKKSGGKAICRIRLGCDDESGDKLIEITGGYDVSWEEGPNANTPFAIAE